MWSRFVMSQVKHNSYFLFGVALGLWASLAVVPLDEGADCGGVAPPAAPAPPDEFEPRREQRPLGAAGPPAGRSVQRPRYYSTELGMRGSLLTGVLSSEDALKSQVAALNQTMARLQPALKFFITASAMSSVPGLANVVGFTDTREMLKPFHALKYLADNYLEEYDFFFLVADGAFVNARRLAALVARLSASQDVHMGAVAGDGQYCSLEGGIILSNSVVRAVHGELDWCVRNSYSPHHHENLGRCVLHAAHLACSPHHQGESYVSVRFEDDGDWETALDERLADAVTAGPAPPARLHALHAHVARVQLQRARAAERRLRGDMLRLAARHPPRLRNASWPAGLRADVGLAPPRADTRFDHPRWMLFNASHAFMPDELRAVTPLAPPTKDALDMVVREAVSWARRRWPWAERVELAEGGRLWEWPRALRYRLLLRLTAPQGAQVLRLVEAARALGAARLVPVRYVTESARLAVLLPVALEPGAVRRALAGLGRHADPGADLHLVALRPAGVNSTAAASLLAALREAADTLRARLAVNVHITEAEAEAGAGACAGAGAGARAGRAAVRLLPKDALVLLAPPDLEYTQDFLNRVRMNTIQGEQWFLPLPYSRYAPPPAPAAAPAPAPRAGRFNRHTHAVLSFYRSDLDSAEAEWRGGDSCDIAAVLAASPLRALMAPEPGAAAAPPPRPAPRTPRPPLASLNLGDRAALARLLLQAQHDAL